MPWTAKDAATHITGLTEAQAKKWAAIANAAQSACKARAGIDCEGFALRVASARAKGTHEESDRDYMRGHLGDALRELSTGPLTGKQKQGEHARLLGVARTFDLTEATLMDVEALEDVEIAEWADLHAADGVKWDDDAGVARNVKIMGMSSANGYDYSEKAGDDVQRLAENIPIFQNHPDKKTGRLQEQSAGFFRNTRRVANGSRGDWYVPPRLREDVKWAIANNAPGSGMSINGQGKMRGRGKGQRGLVESVLRLQSVDYVAHPATTNSLSESTQESGDGLIIEETPVVERTAEQEPLNMDELKETNAKLDTALTQLAEMQKGMADERAARIKAESEAAKVRLVNEAIEESKKAVDGNFRKILERCETKAEMLGALASVATDKTTTAPPAPDGVTKPIAEGKDNAKKIDKALDALFESTRTRTVPGMKILGEEKGA